MKTVLLTFLLISVISFSGCSKDCPEPKEPKTVTEFRYLKRPLPKIEDKPKFVKYNAIMVNFNGNDYYAIPRIDGSILSTNWLQYRDWAEKNYKILKDIENEENNATK